MLVVSWIFVFLFSGVIFWEIYHFRYQRQKLQSLKASLREARQKQHAQEEKYTQNETRWQQNKEKLRGYLQLMDTLINTMPNPIYFKDADGIFQGCNMVYSKQILGLTRDRIIGKHPDDLTDQIPADLGGIYQREEAKMVAKSGFHSFEAKAQCADGQRRDFLFNMAPVIDSQGEINGSVAVLADLTIKNRAARDCLQKEKLEGVLETAGAVCHEFNQPLQALSGYAELMAMKLDGHEASAYIEKLNAQIERMRNITDRLQGITRYETTGYAGNTRIIDLRRASEKG
jgi:PAS domain S-box-containing protein